MTSETSPVDFRPFLEDLLRLGLQGSEGYTNRPVDQIQLEYITNPYGRQPPHLIVFPDGRIEPMTSFQLPVPGYAANVLAIEVMGIMGQVPTPTQRETIARLGREVRQMLPGRLGFTGHAALVAQDAGQRLDAGEIDRPALPRIAVVEREVGRRRGGGHGEPGSDDRTIRLGERRKTESRDGDN